MSAAYLIIWAVFWVPEKMTEQLMTAPDNFPDGIGVFGVKWQQRYSPLVYLLSNNGYNKENVDIYFATNAQITEAGFDMGGNICSGALYHPAALWGTIGFTSVAGTNSTIPIKEMTSSQLYKLHCDKIQKNTNIRGVVALINTNDEAAKANLKWAEVSVSMDAGNRATYLRPTLSCFSQNKNDCQFPLMPNDWRTTFYFMFLESLGVETDLESNCPSEGCVKWTAYYGIDLSGALKPPADQHQGSPR